MKDTYVLHEEYSVFIAKYHWSLIFYTISPNYFLSFNKFHWFRLKTIKSGQNQLGLADVESYLSKQRSLWIGLQNSKPSKAPGRREQSGLIISICWILVPMGNRHRAKLGFVSWVPVPQQTRSQGRYSPKSPLQSQSTCNLLYTTDIFNYYTSLSYTGLSIAGEPQLPATLTSLDLWTVVFVCLHCETQKTPKEKPGLCHFPCPVLPEWTHRNCADGISFILLAAPFQNLTSFKHYIPRSFGQFEHFLWNGL